MDAVTQQVLAIFEELSAVPRGSGNEAGAARWVMDRAAAKGFAVRQDRAGNVLVEVPASPGREQAPGVILQGHLDMVCEKTPDSTHDFTRDPIRLVREGDWLHADGTTLGADNGIAVAMALALAEDTSVSHPPLELLFTVREEIGLQGAAAIEPGFLRGRILLNLDSEEEGELTIGCAGGRTSTLRLPLVWEAPAAGTVVLQMAVEGLRGGHSGVDIDKHRANAHVLLARALTAARRAGDARLLSIQGGTVSNAIPRRAEALVACPAGAAAAVQDAVRAFQDVLRQEYAATEPDLSLRAEPAATFAAARAATADATDQVLRLLLALPNGVAEMSASIPGVVETSSNVAIVGIKGDALEVVVSHRSAVASRLDALLGKTEAVALLARAAVSHSEGYPAWQPDANSPLLKRCLEVHRDLFGKEAAVRVMHAGLEPGAIGSKYPDMEMISLGPTVENPHSPGERLYVPSVRRTWDLLVGVVSGM